MMTENSGDLPRVLHVGRVDFLGGAERVMMTLAASRAMPGRSAIAAPAGGDLEVYAHEREVPFYGAPIERSRADVGLSTLTTYPGRWVRAAQALGKICDAVGPDIIHAHHPVTALQAGLAARGRGVPIILHLHDIGPPKPLYFLALAAAVRTATQIVCVSGASRDLADMTKPPKGVPVVVVHNGVDPAFEAIAKQVEPADLDGPGPHIGLFGVIERRKGHHVLLAAAPKIMLSAPSAVFWLVGSAASGGGTYVEELQYLIAAENLEGAVRMTGYRKDVAALMKRMDVVVQPSVGHESLSMSILEALTLGRPVVATQIGGSAEAISDGLTGKLVPSNDASALAEAVLSMLTPDGGQVAARAQAEAQTRFSSKIFVEKIERLYSEVLSHR